MEIKKVSDISKDQARDTGMAMTLLLLILCLFTGEEKIVTAAILVLVMTMTWPVFFKPMGVIWFGFSQILGNVVSRIFLAVLFYGIVTPVGILRRMAGKDSLGLKAWKGEEGSVFVHRDHLYTGKDLEKPY